MIVRTEVYLTLYWFKNDVSNTLSVVVITFALHAKGRGFEPHSVYFLFFFNLYNFENQYLFTYLNFS